MEKHWTDFWAQWASRQFGIDPEYAMFFVLLLFLIISIPVGYKVRKWLWAAPEVRRAENAERENLRLRKQITRLEEELRRKGK